MKPESAIKIFVFSCAGIFIILTAIIFVSEGAKEKQKTIDVKTYENVTVGDFVRFNGTWYPVKQKEGKGENIYIQIRLITRETMNLNKFYLTNYVDSVITLYDREKWIELARFHLVHN